MERDKGVEKREGDGMKAKELMIGDLINGFGVVRRVTGIHGLERPEDDGLLTTMVPGCEFPESNLSFRPCYARPIPLTEEILEKNGFEELMSKGEEVAAMFGRKPEPTGVWQYGFGRFDSVAYVPERSFLRIKFMEGYQADIANIKYVHELQHALWLCGVEMEVEL